VDDIRAVLRAGADKVAINTAAIATPEFIKEAARVFGSSTITVGIEVVRGADGTYEAFTDFGRESTGIDAFQWAVRAVELGAGELMVTSIDREGTGTGFDLELIRRISEAVPVPVIASGGAGSVQHVYEVIAEGKADAVCLASLLHYNYVRHTDDRASDIAEAAGNVEFLRGGAGFSMIRDAPLEEIRSFLASMGIATRQV
jgi:cyclase